MESSVPRQVVRFSDLIAWPSRRPRHLRTLGIQIRCLSATPSRTDCSAPAAPRAGLLVVTISARRAGPREHGRQAARSKRDRPERASE
jgi:hypothetical protein